MLYNPPTGATDPNAPYVGKNLAAGQQGSRIPPQAVETTQREVVNAILEAGLSPTNDDVKQLLKAIRSGALSTFLATGTANDLIITPITPHASVYRGLRFTIYPTLSNTGPVTLTTNGITKPVQRRDGTPLAPGDFSPLVPIDVIYDGAAAYKLVGFAPSEVARNASTGSVTVWVRSDGDDAQDGTANLAGKAFKTIQAAYEKAVLVYGIAQPITIQIGVPGSYAPMTKGFKTAGDLTILGDETNKASYVVTGNPASRPQVNAGSGAGVLTFRGLTLQNNGGSATTFAAGATIFVQFYNVAFVALSATSAFHIAANDGAIVGIGDGCSFTGQAAGIAYANGGIVSIGGPGLAVIGSPAWTVAGVYAKSNGKVIIAPGVVFSGSATGPRAGALNQGLVDTNGQGQTILPGSSNGTASGGLIV